MEDSSENCFCDQFGIVPVIIKQNGKLVIAVQSKDFSEWMLSQQFHLSQKQVDEFTKIFCGHSQQPISCFGKEYISLTLILLHVTKAALEEKLFEISTAVNIIEKILWDVLTDTSLEGGLDRQENMAKEKMTVTNFTKLRKSKQILGLYYIYLGFLFFNFG